MTLLRPGWRWPSRGEKVMAECSGHWKRTLSVSEWLLSVNDAVFDSPTLHRPSCITLHCGTAAHQQPQLQRSKVMTCDLTRPRGLWPVTVTQPGTIQWSLTRDPTWPDPGVCILWPHLTDPAFSDPWHDLTRPRGLWPVTRPDPT